MPFFNDNCALKFRQPGIVLWPNNDLFCSTLTSNVELISFSKFSMYFRENTTFTRASSRPVSENDIKCQKLQGKLVEIIRTIVIKKINI